MTTNISVMDDGYNATAMLSQPVMGMFALYQNPVAKAPVVEEDDAVSAEADCQAKVITGPRKTAAKAATDGVVTK